MNNFSDGTIGGGIFICFGFKDLYSQSSSLRFNLVEDKIHFVKDIKNKKIKKNDLINYIDIVLIDFNKTQKNKCIYKSTNIQILYFQFQAEKFINLYPVICFMTSDIIKGVISCLFQGI